MITMNGKDGRKSIQYAFSNVIHECDGNMYIPEMPTIICNNKKDAERIQEDVAALITYITNKILNKGEN